MGSLKAKFRLEDSYKITTFLDTRVKIKIMTWEVMKDVGLAMRQRPKLELVFHIGYSRLFLSLCKNVGVTIGGLKIRHPIFVAEHDDYDIIFGQLFLNSVKFSKEYTLAGIFDIITYL